MADDEDAYLIPQGMTNDCVAQIWYRFLRIIGDPVILCSPQIISRTPYFMQHMITLHEPMEPHQHPCLLALPLIFLKAIKGIASQVNAFLGKMCEENQFARESFGMLYPKQGLRFFPKFH